MLEYLRNAADKPVAKVLIGILAFSFVGWGVAEWIFGGAAMDNTLINVGNSEISVNHFNAEKSRQLAQMPKDVQRVTYTDAVAMDLLNKKVIETLSTQQMAQNRAKDLGFVVSDARIAREIRSYPEFQQNGQFSTFLFDAILNNSGYSEADFANVLRNQIMRSMVLGSMSVPMPVPDFMLVATYNARNATRQIEYTKIDFSEFSVKEPTEDELKVYYEQNPRIVPEMRDVSYVFIPADMDKPDAYDAAYAKAVAVEDTIISGDTLADAARANSVKYSELKSLVSGQAKTDDVIDAVLMAKIWQMDEGVESELIETKKGFVIIRVEKIVPSHNAEFASVKNSLVADWKHAQQEKQAYVRANEILVDLNKNGKLPDKKSANVLRTSGAPIAILNAAFNNAIGSNSLVATDDAFYVMHIESEKMPTIDKKKLSGLKKEVKDAYSTQIMDDYNSFLMREYPIEINQKLYNRVVAK